ncbi:MAG: sigma factor, partial [Planctomycetota bacterium]
MSKKGLVEKVEAARKGDQAAFGELITAYERQVVAHFMGVAPSPDVAEELAQETFVRAYMSLSKL